MPISTEMLLSTLSGLPRSGPRRTTGDPQTSGGTSLRTAPTSPQTPLYDRLVAELGIDPSPGSGTRRSGCGCEWAAHGIYRL